MIFDSGSLFGATLYVFTILGILCVSRAKWHAWRYVTMFERDLKNLKLKKFEDLIHKYDNN